MTPEITPPVDPSWQAFLQDIADLERSGHPFNERIRLMGALVRAKTIGGMSPRNMVAIERSKEAGRENASLHPGASRDHRDIPPDRGASRYAFDDSVRLLKASSLSECEYATLYSVLWVLHEENPVMVDPDDYARLKRVLDAAREAERAEYVFAFSEERPW